MEKIQPVGPFEHVDPGHRADPNLPNLLKDATKVFELSPHCGTEIHGVQIVSSFCLDYIATPRRCEGLLTGTTVQCDLSSEGLDELALMCAERGCLVFRDQTYTDAGFARQKEIAQHFGNYLCLALVIMRLRNLTK